MKSKSEITKQTYSEASSEWNKKRTVSWDEVSEFLDTIENKNKLLDIGCGTGRDIECAVSKGFDKNNCIGVDYAQGQITELKKKGFNGVCADMKQLPFEDQSFDTILCIASLHHLLTTSEQEQALLEIKRVLKKQGRVLISVWVPEQQYIDSELRKQKWEYVEDNIVKVLFTYENKKLERYYYLFKTEELINLLEKLGFQIKETRYENGNYFFDCEQP